MATSLLSQINKDSHHWNISVVVSRMWHYRGGTDVGPIKHTDLVLIDARGGHMYGQIPPGTADRLKDVLQEGKVYVIRKFLCTQAKPTFRPVESPFMVQFTRYTIVEESPGLEVHYPFCTYSLTAFADIPQPSGPPQRFIDVIGKISQVSDIIPVQSMYQTTASDTRTIVLTDLLGAEMRIVLWGERATDFDADAVRAMGAKEPVIAIFVGTLPKTNRGVVGLSGSAACRWYIDEDIDDINEFRAGLGDTFVTLAAYDSTNANAIVPRVYEPPVEMTMKQLNDVDPFTDMGKRFICTVTVDEVGSDQRWWFASCSLCRKSSKHDGYQYQCSGTACGSVKAELAYCVSVFASDDTGGAEFVLFDKVGAAAVGKQLMPLLRQRYPGYTSVDEIATAARNDTGVPTEISRLVGQKYRFLVSISKKWETGNSEDLSFQVCRIEETYKPELPPLSFPVVSGSATPSSSSSRSGAWIPPQGSALSPVLRIPPSPRSNHAQSYRGGNGTPPSPATGPQTPAKGSSSAPMRGARRSLFAIPTKEQPATVEAPVLHEEVIQSMPEIGPDDAADIVEDKTEHSMNPKKRGGRADKGAVVPKKNKA